MRTAAGCSQAGWAAQLGYHRATIQRWEQGSSEPDPAARQALSDLCQARGLFRTYSHGPLRGLTLTPALLADVLAERRQPPSDLRVTALRPAPASPRGGDGQALVPLQLTSFVGRRQELATISELLQERRLVTLTGPGGTGKTRLAIEAARTLAPAFADGVFFVDLAGLEDPGLIPAAVARVLHVREQPGIPLLEALAAPLSEKQVLLVLDNYEHLLAGAAVAGTLAQAGPAVVVLVTSRAPLRLRGEVEVTVPPLPLPGATIDDVAALAENAAVSLFVARAQDIRAGFALTAENAPAIAALCRRLDGLPLAIELAAARTRLLPPTALLARLTHRLPLLSGGARDAPARHQTLRNAISWSYDLLDPADQRLFCRLAVFAGSTTLELVTAVCDMEAEGGAALEEGLSTLIENNLLTVTVSPTGEPRVRMLETVRACALIYLDESGEAERVRLRLAEQLLRLVRRCASTLDWARLDSELDNVRVALGWCVEQEELALGARLVWALGAYWLQHRGDDEFDAWRQRLLALPAAAQPAQSRARLLVFTGFDAVWTSRERRDRAAAELEEVIAISRTNGDTACLALGLHMLALVYYHQGRYAAAVPVATEAVARSHAQGAFAEALRAHALLVNAVAAQGQMAEAEALLAEQEALAQHVNDEPPFSAATLAILRGDWEQARALWEENARVFAAMGELNIDRLDSLDMVGWAAFQQRDLAAALHACTSSLTLHAQRGRSAFPAPALGLLALVAEQAGLLPASAHLLGFVEKQRQAFGLADILNRPAAEREAAARIVAEVGAERLAELWTEGASLDAQAAIALGLALAAKLLQGVSSSQHASDAP